MDLASIYLEKDKVKEIVMKANGITTRNKEQENIFGQMEILMKENSNKERR
jgi:hypothetical protein